MRWMRLFLSSKKKIALSLRFGCEGLSIKTTAQIKAIDVKMEVIDGVVEANRRMAGVIR
jgi:hypothetical protein